MGGKTGFSGCFEEKCYLCLKLLISVVPIGVVGYMNFSRAKSSIEHDQLLHLEFVTDVKVKRINTFFKNVEDDIRITQDYFNIIKNLPIVAKFSDDRSNPKYLKAKEELDSQLKAWLRIKNGTMIDLMLVNLEGTVVYAANEEHVAEDLDNSLPDPSNKAFEEGKKGVYFTNIFKNKVNDYNLGMLVTAPIYDNGNFIGVIAFAFDMGPIYDSIQDTTGLGETGETLIGKQMEPHGHFDHVHVVFLNTLRHDPDAALKRMVEFGSDKAIPLQEAVQGKRGTGYSVDYRGEEIMAHWRYIPERDWGIVAKIDKKEAFVPINDLKKKTKAFMVFTGFIVVFIAYFAAKTISNPIIKLSDQTIMITKGDLNGEVLFENRHDEIGILASNFNVMVKQLKKRIHELEEFHKVTVNRELKMIELEKEIELLKEKSDKVKESG